MMQCEVAQLPIQERLRAAGQPLDQWRGKLHRGVMADLDHEIAHFIALDVNILRRRGQGLPHGLQLSDWSNFGRTFE